MPTTKSTLFAVSKDNYGFMYVKLCFIAIGQAGSQKVESSVATFCKHFGLISLAVLPNLPYNFLGKLRLGFG